MIRSRLDQTGQKEQREKMMGHQIHHKTDTAWSRVSNIDLTQKGPDGLNGLPERAKDLQIQRHRRLLFADLSLSHTAPLPLSSYTDTPASSLPSRQIDESSTTSMFTPGVLAEMD